MERSAWLTTSDEQDVHSGRESESSNRQLTARGAEKTHGHCFSEWLKANPRSISGFRGWYQRPHIAGGLSSFLNAGLDLAGGQTLLALPCLSGPFNFCLGLVRPFY